MALIMKLQLKNFLFLFIMLNSFYLYSQVDAELKTKTIVLRNISRKKIPIKLCICNRNDTVLFLENVNKVIYDQNDILKTIIIDSILDNYNFLKFKVTDSTNYEQPFLNIPGYGSLNEQIYLNRTKTADIVIPKNRKVCKKYLLDLSNIDYKIRPMNNYFIRIYMIHNRDTLFFTTPLVLKVKKDLF